VLLLEDQTSAPAVEAIERDLLPTLEAKFTGPVDYYRESLDTILVPDENYQEEVRQWYQHKYAKRKLDLVIAIGPQSHEFLSRSHEQFFPGVPVIFCIDLKSESSAPVTEPGLTGIWLDPDPVSTVNVARQLLPNTKRVVVVAGSGYFDQKFTRIVQKKLLGYSGVEFVYLPDLDIGDLPNQVGSLPKDTVILFLAVTRDRSRRHFFARDAVRLIANAANVPVFGLVDTMVGRGAVGGKTYRFSGQGLIAADMALRILEGQKIEEIPAVVTANLYVFDWKQLERWRIDDSHLPPGTILLNRELNVWERYKFIIIGVAALLLLQTVLLAYLFIEHKRRRNAQAALEHDIAERKKAEEALMDISSRMITAQEEERSRIARELHDDFSQRLGMLAIDLERTALIIPDDPRKAVQQMHELWKRTSTVGGDINKLSHALHSSVLDFLGLSEGIKSLCDDVAEQQGMHISFSTHDVPRNVPSATSLCLFRIAQEGLRNVRKHSGIDRASVQLTAQDHTIEMIIADEGVGFNPEGPATKRGLGLRSMQERLRIVGGTVEVQSKPGNGTRLVVHAPL
jgi:signal transduction histidine kinase